MAVRAPIFCNFPTGTAPVLQEGSTFTDRQWGLDDGRRTFLVHPESSRGSWPKKGDQDKEYLSMFVAEVTPRNTESTLIELAVAYKGFTTLGKPVKVDPDSDLQMMTLPIYRGGQSANMLVPVPQPYVSAERVVTTAPNYQGVGDASTEAFLPAQPTFNLTYTPDPGKPPTVNYKTGWLLTSRAWSSIILGKVWLVRERYTYYYPLAST